MMTKAARKRQIKTLERYIARLERELQVLLDEEARLESDVKAGDTIEIDHTTILSKGKKIVRRYRVLEVTGGSYKPEIRVQQIRKDGSLGKPRGIWQNYKKVEPTK